ncbi:MAG TPA: ATP-binding protein [Cellulomonas sp.]|uniref:sacsin N-terminal ATP-binding-like domain-containing protein n=1 Tax=Cellulomonas sp. TaxID=40001 RepID=UPI002E37976C|nr:ATP-binding protein [Cellulomonas sp.]HEX5332052.1 ATP-binding protein [Cellulomonas sp.]
MTRDAFGTAALRAAVLGAWRASPARLREDANTEEDHARGYYRDRVLVELAQNAADAATRAGVPGRLLLRLASTPDGEVLIAANTGEPLDDAGVASLASMRASAKRDGGPASRASHGHAGLGVVGRFGVGFAAVRAVADEVSVLSTSGGVRFSLADTQEMLARASEESPALADEVRRRDGSLPALRLPLPAEGAPPTGYDTAVVLELRDEVAADEVRALLAQVGDPMLLALPGLVEIVVEDDTGELPVRRVADVADRWRVASAHGELDLALLADRPVEERGARAWRVTWAVPRTASGSGARDLSPDDYWSTASADPALGAHASWHHVVHAPTPTDEPCSVPALLVATLPLDPTRRHVAAGPLTDAVLDHAARVYARLAVSVAVDGGDPLDLVPTGLPAGALDGSLRELIVERLARTPLLAPAAPAAEREPGQADAVSPVFRAGTGAFDAMNPLPDDESDGAGRIDVSGAADIGQVDPDSLVEPRRAVAVVGAIGRDPVAVGALALRASGLVRLAPGTEAAARTLGVELRELADLVEELPAMHSGPPEEWRDLYAALEPAATDAAVREALGSLPVPLADGRMVRGPRGLVQLPAEDVVVDTDAAAGSEIDLETSVTGGWTGTGILDVLARWGLRVVHPAAQHPLLTQLGAEEVDAAGLLRHAAVRQAVLDQADDDDLEVARDVTEAVLTLVRHALGERTRAGDRSPRDVVDPDTAGWLGLLTLTAADGEPTPAHGLVLTGSVASRLLDPRVLAPVELATIERWGADVLVAAGVRDDLVAVRVTDVVADPAQLDDEGNGASALAAQSLDGWPEYVAALSHALGRGAYVPEVVAVADLDAVDAEAWAEVLDRLATQPALRRALLDPVRAEGQGGREAPSYTAWWLRARAGIGLDHPFATAEADDAVRRLLPPAPESVRPLDAQVQRALGGVATLTSLDAAAWARVLAGLGPAGSPVDLALATALWRAWATLAADADRDGGGPGGDVELVPALVDERRVVVVHADDAAVADAPMWLQRTDVAALVPAPPAIAAALAALLDVPLASELAEGAVDDNVDGPREADLVPTPEGVLALLPDAPLTWVEHETLHVDGTPVDWWVEGVGADAVVHATQLAGLARGLAQAAGRWVDRHAVEVVLTEPLRAQDLAVEMALDPAAGLPA